MVGRLPDGARRWSAVRGCVFACATHTRRFAADARVISGRGLWFLSPRPGLGGTSGALPPADVAPALLAAAPHTVAAKSTFATAERRLSTERASETAAAVAADLMSAADVRAPPTYGHVRQHMFLFLDVCPCFWMCALAPSVNPRQ